MYCGVSEDSVKSSSVKEYEEWERERVKARNEAKRQKTKEKSGD